MEIPGKNKHVHTFTGGMDSDTAAEYMPPNKVRYMLNVNCFAVGDRGVVKNTKGNIQIPFQLPAGENACIGKALDDENSKFYFFIWNNADRHCIYEYNDVTKSVVKLIENLTDTGNLNILNFQRDFLILMADVIKGRLYWVDAYNNARKTNIAKLLDKSPTGYGSVIQQSFIDAYKRGPGFPPIAVYASDPDKQFNKMYGGLRKFIYRFIYDDGEKSSWSDFSGVPLPDKESFIGVNAIPTNNNCIDITVNTGDRTVVQIEIATLSTSYEITDDAGLVTLPWGIIARLDKRKLSISDNANYVFRYYNDLAPLPTSQEKVIRPYSYLPPRPRCQSFGKNVILYSNFPEGFETVDIDMSASVLYQDLFIEDGSENEYNKPVFTHANNPGGDYISNYEHLWDVNNVESIVIPGQGPIRVNGHTLTIGNDVKQGNKFELTLVTGGGDNFYIAVTATRTDTAATIANKIKQQLIATGRIYRRTEELPDTNIYNNTIDGDGNISFSFLMRASKKQNYLNGSTYVNPIQYNTLKDTGQSIRNQKLGSATKYGIEYEDYDGRKTLGYTDDSLLVPLKTINELGGYKSALTTLTINHKPPKWAWRYQIVRSPDLVYGQYIQMLIQSVVTLTADENQEFLDLVVGSLFTYKKIHPNSPLSYEFKKGDRIRFMKKTADDDSAYYPFFETEIISYNSTVTERIRSNVVTAGTDNITVNATNTDNIGKFIVIEGSEREITSVVDGTHYQVDSAIGSNDAKTYLFYDLVDRRGSIRIRKPEVIELKDNSLVEIFTPSSVANALSSIQFNEFQKKFNIINPGSDNPLHAGSTQNQTDILPALVTINEGTAYVRQRALPINNAFPGTQQLVETIEDPSYSDFYPSLLNDNGRVTTEDRGDGVVHFGSRVRYSNNFIEDTRINGLNDFDNLDREDYNDKFGDIMLTDFDGNRLFTFKKLRNAYIPMDARLVTDADGNPLNVGSTKLLNPMQYFSIEDGGIGDHPESFAKNNTHKYLLASNNQQLIRIGGNGEEPISNTFFMDKDVRDLVTEANKNGARIYGGFDKDNKGYVVTVEGYNKYIYFDGFNSWVVDYDELPINTPYEIVTAPTHGITVLNADEITYTPNNNYIGSDNFTYRAMLNGVWSQPKKVCITVNDIPNQFAWRPKESSAFCIQVDGENTGYKGWNTLEQYNTFSNMPTGTERPNSTTDAEYAAPIFDPEFCPVEPPTPVCPDRVFAIQICNENSAIDDNFDVFLNDEFIGPVVLDQSAQIGSVFIAADDEPDIVSSDFACPLDGMQYFYFNPEFLQGGTNEIRMVNTQNNGNSNAGTVGMRNYLRTGNDLSSPCVVANNTYNGPSGSNFMFTFEYTECCPEDE